MARRRKEDVWFSTIIQIAALIGLLAFVFPQVRRAIYAAGVVAVWVAILAFVALIGLLVYRAAIRRSRRSLAAQGYADLTTLRAVQPDQYAAISTKELIKQLRSIDWFQFEKLVAALYGKLGYEVLRKGGANPDGGIDLIITKSGQRVAIQCKQWKTWNVGVKAVREFLGALKDAGIEKGIFVTVRGYTGEAKKLADKHHIEILNETGLARMLNETNARFDPAFQAQLRNDTKHCPKCEREMILKIARKGRWTGQSFWGCSAYPRCTGRLVV